MATNSPIPNPKSSGSDTFSSRLAQENVLNEGSFGTPKTPVAGAEAATATHARRRFKLQLWHYLLAAGVIVLLLLLIFWLYRALNKENKTASTTGDYATTAVDLGDLKGTTPGGTSKLLVNGQALISGSLTANSFVGDGADLTNLNATNITSGTLNDARLTPNVALLNANQTFIGVNTFTGQVSLPATTSIANQAYNWPNAQAPGSLVNDGNGNLNWSPSGGCVVCILNGGNSFGATTVIGTNDPFNLELRTGGASRLTISSVGSSLFSGAVSAASFSGDGLGLTNLDATQLTTGTLSNARLSASVTTQGNVFNGINQLVQIDALGNLPALNAMNLTNLNASNLSSGTVADGRLSANVALLNAANNFSNGNTFAAGITTNTIDTGAGLTVGNTARSLTLQGNATTNISATTGGNTTTVAFAGVPTGSVTYNFDRSAAPGTYTICTTAGGACGGGGGGTISSPGGTVNKLAKFTAAQTIADSSISDTGSAVSIQPAANSTATFQVLNAGGGTSIFDVDSTNGRVGINNATPSYTLDVVGDINSSTGLRIGGTLISSANLTNNSDLAKLSANQTFAGNNTFSNPVTVNTLTPTGAMTIGSTTQNLALQGNANTSLSSTNAGGSVTIGFNGVSTGNVTYQFDATAAAGTYTICTTAGGACGGGGGGTVSSPGGTANKLAKFTAAQTIADSSITDTGALVSISAPNVSINGAPGAYALDVTGDINAGTYLRVGGNIVCDSSGCTPGSLPGNVTLQGNTFNGITQLVQTNGLGYLPALNGGNLTSLNASNITSGTLSDARLTNNVALLDANQTFTGTNAFTQTVTVNTLTPTGAMTIGATNQNLTLRGNASTSLNSTNAGGTVSVGFSGVSSGSVAYQFDATATPGTYTICTTAGGACGGTISSLGGTTNKIAKFSGAQSIADSSITDTGSAITVQPSGNSTTTFQVKNAGGTSIFDVDTTNGRVGVNNDTPSYPLDVTGDINSTTGLRVGGVLVCTNTGCITGGGGGSFIQNQTTQQSAANFFIQSVAAGNISGVIKAIAAQTADLLQFQNSSGTPIANVTANGTFNTTTQYQVNGVQISSADLSNNSNLAKLNATQLFTGNNSFSGTISQQNAANSTSAFSVLNAGASSVFNVDTTNGRVGVNNATPSYPLDVTGDINSSTGLRVGGTLVCDITGCAASGSSGFYIQNGVAQQTSANFNIQSTNVNNVVGVLQGKSGQVADLFNVNDGTGAIVFKVNNAGLTTINNGISLTGGNQSITNNTGGLNLVSNGTTIGLNNTATITSGDGTGLRYAGSYAFQPLSLVSRAYVDAAISGVVVGACPTCFLNGGNSFGIAASAGTNDNNTFALETANTQRILLGTNGGIALQGSTASGNYSTSIGSSVSSGDYSLSYGFNNSPGITSVGGGSLAGGYALSYPITANGYGSIALGLSRTGAITTGVNAEGSFAGGDNSSVGNAASNSIAYGQGARANGVYSAAFNSGTASGNGAFAVGNATASGPNSFAGGYFISYATTASGYGSMAFGAGRDGVVTASGEGSFAGGNNSTATAQNAIAFGSGTHATGSYSAAFNNSLASNTGAFAINNATASGLFSFAGGSNGSQAYAQDSFAYGYNVKANDINGISSVAFGRDSTANHNYSFAAGYGARASGGEANAAFNYALSSGAGSFAIGSTLVNSSGTYSFAGGYAGGAITSSNNGSFAFGYSGGNAISATAAGAFAIGASRDGAILASGLGALAGGTNSTASNEFAIAYGTGTQATGAYSAAFNNSIASGTGAFAIGNGTASGALSFAGGEGGTQAYGRSSFAYGYNVKANDINGNYSVAFGRDSSANHNYSFAAGYGARTTNGEANAAFNYALASGNGAFAIGSTLVNSSGTHSFAGGYAQSAITSSNNGSFAFGRAIGYTMSATGEGAFAIGASRDGAILASGLGALAGGTNSTASNEFAIAYGNGTRATGAYSAAFNSSTASGTGAFSVGGGTASGTLSFAGGYNQSAITASNNGSFAFGRAIGYTMSATGEGAFAIGASRDGAILASGLGSLAGGTNSTASGEYAFAYGTGTQATGFYSAAFNNSVASNSGAFAINNATASGLFSFAGGENGSLAAGRNSFAFGYTTKANNVSGQMSVAMGRETTANGSYSFALGYGATASNDGAFAIGATSIASGAYSFAGYNSTASNSGAFAFGDTNTASGQFSTTFGTLNTASGFNSTAFGRRMNVSGNYSFGVSLNDTALNVTDPNSFVINAGYVGINTASPSSYSSAFSLVGTGYTYGSTVVSTGIASRVRAGDNSSGTLVQFERGDGAVVGTITHNGSNTAYNTSSDARLKHDITDTSLSLDTVLQLQVHDFVYNNDTSNTVTTGFIAQELQKLYPEAVSVMDPATGYLGVDYGKLTPLLAKGIQDLNTKVDNLQSQTDQLKTALNAIQTTSGGTATSVDILKTLADAKVINLSGDLIVGGNVVVTGRTEVSTQNKAQISIPAGQTSVVVALPSSFASKPNVSITPQDFVDGQYRVTNVTKTSFTLELQKAQTTDTSYFWQAL